MYIWQAVWSLSAYITQHGPSSLETDGREGRLLSVRSEETWRGQSGGCPPVPPAVILLLTLRFPHGREKKVKGGAVAAVATHMSHENSVFTRGILTDSERLLENSQNNLVQFRK